MGSTLRHVVDGGMASLDGMTLALLLLGCLLVLLGGRRGSLVLVSLGGLVLLDLPWGMSLAKRSGVLDPLLEVRGPRGADRRAPTATTMLRSFRDLSRNLAVLVLNPPRRHRRRRRRPPSAPPRAL